MFKNFIYPVATLAGTIIGAGIFALPYITLQVGIWTILGYFFIVGSLALLIHLLFSEIVLKTPDFLRLPGYAHIYLGNWGRRIATISMMLGFYGAILVYLILGGEFLKNLFSPIFGGNAIFYTILYFFLGAVLIYFGIRAIAKIEFWGFILFFIVLIAIFFRGLPFLKIENLFVGEGGFKDLFLPYGPIFFSLWGASIIPEIEEMLGKNKNLLKKVIIIAILLSALVYLFFIFMVLGITGNDTSLEAISGLKIFLGGFVSLAFLFGILTTFTSFLSIGLTLRNTLWYDFKIPRIISWILALFVPLFLFLIGFKNFITIIGLVGGVTLGIDGILILLMYQKIGGKKALVYPLVLVFIAGIVYELIYFIR